MVQAGVEGISLVKPPIRIPAGAKIVSIGGSIGLPLNMVTDEAGSINRVLSAGGGINAQFMYHVTPELGIGVDIARESFGKQTVRDAPITMESKGDISTYLVAVRYVFNPSSPYRLWPVIGFGLGTTNFKATGTLDSGYVWSSNGSAVTKVDSAKSGFAFGLGFGVDADVTDRIMLVFVTDLRGCQVNKTETEKLFTDFSTLVVWSNTIRVGYRF
jgi:opacity protein-like surface antigen